MKILRSLSRVGSSNDIDFDFIRCHRHDLFSALSYHALRSIEIIFTTCFITCNTFIESFQRYGISVFFFFFVLHDKRTAFQSKRNYLLHIPKTSFATVIKTSRLSISVLHIAKSRKHPPKRVIIALVQSRPRVAINSFNPVRETRIEYDCVISWDSRRKVYEKYSKLQNN